MQKQLSTLQQLIEIMDPELFRHLGRVYPLERLCIYININLTLQKKLTDWIFSFAFGKPHIQTFAWMIITSSFRWVLIAFKREFPFDDVLRLWEVLWTDYYTRDFVLFVALAVLESHRDMILRYLVEVRYLSSFYYRRFLMNIFYSSTKF